MMKTKLTGSPLNRRRYMISLNRWRSVMALAACVVTILASVWAIVSSLLEFVPDARSTTSLFQYLTADSSTPAAQSVSRGPRLPASSFNR